MRCSSPVDCRRSGSSSSSCFVTSRKQLNEESSRMSEKLPSSVSGLPCVVVIDGVYAATYRFHAAPLFLGEELIHDGRRLRKIALQSALVGMALSVVGMGFAAFGLLAPVAGAVLQEGIDLLSILNALRASTRPGEFNDVDASEASRGASPPEGIDLAPSTGDAG
jgi:hypothetical protein